MDLSLIKRLDFRALFLMLALITLGCLVIVSVSQSRGEGTIFSSLLQSQLKGVFIGFSAFFFFALLDYKWLREASWLLYFGSVVLLVGVYFAEPVHSVHRWYKLPLIPFHFQPSEYTKLILIIVLSRFLEEREDESRRWRTVFKILLITGIPFILIVRQPDLGTALILLPITLVMCYFGGVKRRVIGILVGIAALILTFILALFLKVFPYETARPLMGSVLKEYQYERFNPDTYHQTASKTAIALGHFFGTGWKESSFTGNKFLPYAHTDSVFAAFTEEFGFVGSLLLLLMFFGLIYFSFQVTAVAKDPFGRLLSSGVAVYLAMHVVINVGMMCGLFPITGVPLPLVSYGGSSLLSTMIALGMLQSVYIRRFVF